MAEGKNGQLKNCPWKNAEGKNRNNNNTNNITNYFRNKLKNLNKFESDESS